MRCRKMSEKLWERVLNMWITPQVLTEDAINITKNHLYAVHEIELFEGAEDGQDMGTLRLRNMLNGEIDEYTVWLGDSALNYFYVCLPVDEDDADFDEEDPIEVYNIETFNLHFYRYDNLTEQAQEAARTAFQLEFATRCNETVTNDNAHLHLMKERYRYLYDMDGQLVMNGGYFLEQDCMQMGGNGHE